jgi:hypothetical protein
VTRFFSPEFLEDLRYWVKTDRRVALRAFDLVEAIVTNPFSGVGKPELLKYLASGGSALATPGKSGPSRPASRVWWKAISS